MKLRITLPVMAILFMTSLRSFGQQAFTQATDIINNIGTDTNTIKAIKKDDWLLSTSEKKLFQATVSFINDPFADLDTLPDVKSIGWLYKAIQDRKIALESSAINNFEEYDSRSISDRDGMADPGNGVATKIPQIDFTTRLIDATAQFLEERVKEEITLNFFDRFKGVLDSFAEVKTIFPNTFLLLSTREDFFLPSLGETWTAAFRSDLAAMPDNIPMVLELPRYRSMMETDNGRAVAASITALTLIKKGMTPEQLIAEMDDRFGDQKTITGKTIGFISLLTQELAQVEPGPDHRWLDWQDLRRIGEKGLRYFFGYVYQKQKASNRMLEPQGKSMGVWLSANISQAQKWSTELMSYLNRLDHLSNMSAAELPDSVVTERSYYYLEEIFNILDLAGRVSEDLFPSTSNKIASFRNVTQQARQLSQAAYHKDYGMMLLGSLSLLSNVVGKDNEALRKVAFYGNFVVDVLSAQTAGEMKMVIRRYAAPAGSYSVKRGTKRSISLNAYPGLYGAGELQAYSWDNAGFITGVTAPIGFSFNAGLKGKKHQGSTSIFVSVIDIGAVLSYRWTNDSEGLPEKIKWQQLFAPGVHWVWGIPKTPLTLMAGAQMTPLLRKIGDTGNTIDPQNMVRAGVTLAVDIPFVYFRK